MYSDILYIVQDIIQKTYIRRSFDHITAYTGMQWARQEVQITLSERSMPVGSYRYKCPNYLVSVHKQLDTYHRSTLKLLKKVVQLWNIKKTYWIRTKFTRSFMQYLFFSKNYFPEGNNMLFILSTMSVHYSIDPKIW